MTVVSVKKRGSTWDNVKYYLAITDKAEAVKQFFKAFPIYMGEEWIITVENKRDE